MKNSREIYGYTFGASIFFAAGMVISLLGMSTLYAGHQEEQIICYLKAKASLAALHHYEDGNYEKALSVARNAYESSLERGLTEEAENLSKAVSRLEKEFLTLGSTRILFDECFHPRVKLLDILELAGMGPLNPSEKPIVQINEWAQKNLLRQGERWQDQTGKFESLRSRIKPLLVELGFVEKTSAHFKHYDGAVVHGAPLPTVRLRLYHLVEQWKQGIRFSRLYFLTGDRPLEPRLENEYALVNDQGSTLGIRRDWKAPTVMPKTESEMMQYVWEQSEIPEDMRKSVDLHCISAPMKQNPNTLQLMRPTTDDTVIEWLANSPSHGLYLAVSNAPFIHRQDLVTRAIAAEGYLFDTIGTGASEQEKIAIFLDEIARLIFQTKKLKDASQ